MSKWLAASIASVVAVLTGAVLLHSCGVSTPAATDNKVPFVFHADRVANGCTDCHEVNRPSPTHGDGKDCVGCHSYVDQKDGSWLPAHPFTHDPAPTTCLPCHTKERPAPPHPADGDCVTCHKFPKWQ